MGYDSMESVARELMSLCETAMYDMAYAGTPDQREIQAEEYYEDVGVLNDFYGDRIYDAMGGNWMEMVKLAEMISKLTNHEPTKVAMASRVERWKKLIKEVVIN